MNNREWFIQAKFGLMVHWGLYSLPGGEWKGRRTPFCGEWMQSYFRIPNKEYEQIATAFNPIYFNADEWVKIAKDAGMQYIVVTSKHHEGFAMFHSKVSKFNIVDATPFKRDVIAELAESCYKNDMKLGLYYSHAIDWHHHDGAGYGKYSYDNINLNKMSWCNDWDYPDNEKKDFAICFEEKTKPQVKEILTNYGDISLIWFDTHHDITADQSKELYNMVKSYQPDCLINSRIGNGMGDYTSFGDNELPEKTYSDGLLYETPATLNDTWGYKAYDQNWKSADKLLEIKNYVNSRGANYLLNVGPDHLGRIPAPSVDILKQVGKKTK